MLNNSEFKWITDSMDLEGGVHVDFIACRYRDHDIGTINVISADEFLFDFRFPTTDDMPRMVVGTEQEAKTKFIRLFEKSLIGMGIIDARYGTMAKDMKSAIGVIGCPHCGIVMHGMITQECSFCGKKLFKS